MDLSLTGQSTGGQSISKVLTVSELTFLIKELIESSFGTLWVEGEISNLSSPFSGHIYFVLKDDASQIRCVMFRNMARQLKFVPENGMKVLIKGDLAVYAARGEYQIIVEHIEPLGIGALALAFEQLKNKLSALGLFDEAKKRPIPYLPKRVAVITSPTGAAIRDFLKVINRRFADLHVIIVPVRVQGDEATKEIVEALKLVNERLDVDVIVITRGGGSLEDLWPFNQEALAFAIRESKIPVVSAVGHEIDWTICDMASDLRAPTPSAAAELLVREKVQLEQRIKELKDRIYSSINNQLMFNMRLLRESKERLASYKRDISMKAQMLDDIFLKLEATMLHLIKYYRHTIKGSYTALMLTNPIKIIEQKANNLYVLKSRLMRDEMIKLGFLRTQLNSRKEHLAALSPLRILERGYTITLERKTKKVIRDASLLTLGDEIETVYSKGRSVSRIIKIGK